MKVAFFSNYLNHHQLPFCLAMQKLTNNNFTFVATTRIPETRLQLGYDDMNNKYNFVLQTYVSKENEEKAMKLALESDVIITAAGCSPEKYTTERIKQNKLTFRYSERIFKEDLKFYKWPRYFASMTLKHSIYTNKPLYMLCCSNFTAHDFNRFGAYKGKCYKWGYFPQTTSLTADELFEIKNKNDKPTLLWVGRLIDWKHCEMAIKLAEEIKSKKMDFRLDIIGTGELETELKEMISDRELEEYVFMLGSKKTDEVRRYMEKADIFLFTSDFNEGWGAVLNESMSSACAVVASHAAGSVGFLIDNNKSGIIYYNENQKDMNNKVIDLLNNHDNIQSLGRAAYDAIANEWNANVAARRILELSEYLMSNKKGTPFPSGICSLSENISNKEAGERILKK